MGSYIRLRFSLSFESAGILMEHWSFEGHAVSYNGTGYNGFISPSTLAGNMDQLDPVHRNKFMTYCHLSRSCFHTIELRLKRFEGYRHNLDNGGGLSGGFSPNVTYHMRGGTDKRSCNFS